MVNTAETSVILGDAHGSGLITPENLGDYVGDQYTPSAESVERLRGVEFAAITGQITSAGKSSIIGGLVSEGWEDIPSRTSRLLRPGEVEGVHKIHCTLADLALGAHEGHYLEIEEVRPGVFYATQLPSNSDETGRKYVKDMELKGVLRLRAHAPGVRAVFPLPPLDWIEEKRVTEWERRHVLREGLTRGVTEPGIDDLEQRLIGVVEEVTRVEELDLIHDPYTLFVVNSTLLNTIAAAKKFLSTGEKTGQDRIEAHIQGVKELAKKALKELLVSDPV